jgi:hypothetical protein
MSGWDFVFAGLELLTYNEARKAQQNLQSMRTTQEIAQAQIALLQAMRNFIFDIARDIQLAEPNIEAYPQQVYIVTSTLGWRLHDSGLVPEMFPEFSDKDYVFKTQNKIVEMVAKSKSLLAIAQVRQSDLAVKFIVEMPLLIRAIQAKWSWEQLQATKAKWEKITQENSARNSSGCLNVVGILGVLFGVMLICSFGFSIAGAVTSVSDNVTVQNILSLPVMGITLLVTAVAFIAGIIFFGKGILKVLGMATDPDAGSLRQKREEWVKNLMNASDWEQVKTTFNGDLTSEEFRKIYNERIAFLEPIMGKDYTNSLLPGNQ